MGTLTPTEEQQHVIDSGRAGDSFVVDACAGSGKTWTLRQTAEAMEGREILYLVYNKAAQLDAQAVFPSNVEVKTTSSIAWNNSCEDYKERMNPSARRIPASETAKMLGIREPLTLGDTFIVRPVSLARLVHDTVDKFAYSVDPIVMAKHVPPAPLGLDPAQADALRSTVLKYARKMWEETKREGSSLRFTFDYAWKLFVLGGGTIRHGAVMLDEAQDSNRVTEQFIKNQAQRSGAQTIVVGDPGQSLYQWRGAVNIMDRFDGPRLTLSQSWRFGEEIADEANKWLAHSGTHIHVKGNPAMDSVVTDGGIPFPDAVLCRGNGSVMQFAMDYLEQGKRVAIVGGVEAIKNRVRAMGDLMSKGETSYTELSAFASWAELVEYAEEEAGGGDLKPLVSLVRRYGISGLLAACDEFVAEMRPTWGREQYGWQPPEVVVSTAHKSKGREWMKVCVADDFESWEPDDVEDPITREMGPGPISEADAMLHYVTVTRARRHLDRGGLAWIDRHPPVDRPLVKAL